MDELVIIRQLQEQNERLRLENELLKARIRELEARLAKYENAHTPPSLRRGRNLKKDKNNKGKPGQKVGHKGVTRPLAIPDSQAEATADRCPDCGAKLNFPFRFESKIIEEIPEPKPVIVTEYKIYRNQPESLIVLFLLFPIGATIEGDFRLDIQHLSLQFLQNILKLLSPNVDASASMASVAFDNQEIGVAFSLDTKYPPFSLIRVKT